MDYNIITSMGTLVLAVFAVISSLLALYSLKRDRKNYLVDAHFKFQTRYREIEKNFPSTINIENEHGIRIWDPTDSEKEHIRNVELYWCLVFDEWYFCNIQDKRLKPLWDNIYSYGVAGALKIPGFKKRINNLMNKKNITLFNNAENFFNEIKKIHKEKNNASSW